MVELKDISPMSAAKDRARLMLGRDTLFGRKNSHYAPKPYETFKMYHPTVGRQRVIIRDIGTYNRNSTVLCAFSEKFDEVYDSLGAEARYPILDKRLAQFKKNREPFDAIIEELISNVPPSQLDIYALKRTQKALMECLERPEWRELTAKREQFIEKTWNLYVHIVDETYKLLDKVEVGLETKVITAFNEHEAAMLKLISEHSA